MLEVWQRISFRILDYLSMLDMKKQCLLPFDCFCWSIAQQAVLIHHIQGYRQDISGIRIVVSDLSIFFLRFFYSLLQKPLFFGLRRRGPYHRVHQYLHHHLFFFPLCLFMLQLHSHLYLSNSVIHIMPLFALLSAPAAGPIPFKFFLLPFFIFNFSYLGPNLIILFPEPQDNLSLLLYVLVLGFHNLIG